MGNWKTVVLDFDGVVHSYVTKNRPWNPLFIPDPPMSGAFQAITDYQNQGLDVVLASARWTPENNTEGSWDAAQQAMRAAQAWFLDHGFPEHRLRRIRFWMDPGKPTGLLYIDDRGMRFEGTFPTPKEVCTFKPWKVEDAG